MSAQSSSGAISAGSPRSAGATPASSPSITCATSNARSARSRSIAARIGPASRASTGSRRAARTQALARANGGMPGQRDAARRRAAARRRGPASDRRARTPRGGRRAPRTAPAAAAARRSAAPAARRRRRSGSASPAILTAGGPPHCGRVTRAIVVCPVLPHPPVSGGQKRTLRLLEAIERAGARPHVLTADGADATDAARPRLDGRARARAAAVAARAARAALGAPAQPVPARRRGAARGAAGRGRRASSSSSTPRAPTTPSRRGSPACSASTTSTRSCSRAPPGGSAPGTVAWLRAWNLARATRAVERSALWRAHTVICVSPRGRARPPRRGRARVVLAPNGVDDPFFDVPPEPGGEQIVFFGHLGYAPNRDGLERFLAEGWPELRRRRPGATLAVAGAGPQDGARAPRPACGRSGSSTTCRRCSRPRAR